MALRYILKKNLEVVRYRIKISEAIDLVLDNFYKVLPTPLVEPVHHFLSDLVDELLWLPI
ncbi:MAG: hypothetical protein ACTSRS_15635 [Candidatus Helarchaeota archaeon]